jgi:hypothetical protein
MGGAAADLDSFCARRRPKSTVGAEESLRRGRTKESAKARKKAQKQGRKRPHKIGLDSAPAHIIPIALAASQCSTSRDFGKICNLAIRGGFGKHGLHGGCESYSVCDVLLAESKCLIAVQGASLYYG